MESVARLPEWLPLLIVLAILSSFFAGPAKRRRRARPGSVAKVQAPSPRPHARTETPPRYARRRFLTDAETRVLGFLEAALPHHRIMAQVAMGALLRADERDEWQAETTRRRFAQKFVDFVIVARNTAEVVALIELDDSSHDAERDAARDAMTAAAGYRTIRIPSRPRPTAESVRAAVADFAGLAAANVSELPSPGMGSQWRRPSGAGPELGAR